MKYALTFFIFILIIGCQNQPDKTHIPPYTADIISLNLSAHQNLTDLPSYTLGPKTFFNLKNLKHMDGPYFKMYRGGTLLLQNDKIIYHPQSSKLNMSYNILNNVIIPQDYSTLAMLSAYYQFDLLAENLYIMSGISILDVVNEFGKYEIYFEPSISENQKGVIIKTYEKENAAYIPSINKFFLFLRSENEHVPLPLNLQVIAHEFGHSIWEYLLKDRHSTYSCDRLTAEYAITGLNEGFADFFSYSLTGSTNILYNSIPSQKLEKMRDFSKITFTYETVADIANERNSICDQSFYCVGTLFASALLKAQKKLQYNLGLYEGPKSRSEFLTKIVSALKTTRENIIYLPSPPFGFDPCLSGSNDTSTAYDGYILGLFFNALLSQIDDKPLQNALCHSLSQNFNEFGFASSLREGYCQ